MYFWFLLTFVMFNRHNKTFNRVCVDSWWRKSSTNHCRIFYQIVSSTNVNSKSNDVCVASSVAIASMLNTLWVSISVFSTSLMCVVRARIRAQVFLLSKSRQEMWEVFQKVYLASRRWVSSIHRILRQKCYRSKVRSSQDQAHNSTYRDVFEETNSREKSSHDEKFAHRVECQFDWHQICFSKHVERVSTHKSIERQEFWRLRSKFVIENREKNHWRWSLINNIVQLERYFHWCMIDRMRQTSKQYRLRNLHNEWRK